WTSTASRSSSRCGTTPRPRSWRRWNSAWPTIGRRSSSRPASRWSGSPNCGSGRYWGPDGPPTPNGTAPSRPPPLKACCTVRSQRACSDVCGSMGFWCLVCGGQAAVWVGSVRVWTHLSRDRGPAPEVEGNGSQGDLGCCLGQAAIADQRQLHALLEGGEGRLHPGPPPGDQLVVALEPRAEFGVMPVGPARQTRLDAGRLQRRLPRVGVVGRIGPHHLLVAADQQVGR